MIPERETLLAQCAAGVAQAQAAGALQAEVVVDATRRLVAGAQSNDLHQIEVMAETQYGVRVILDGGRAGFATTNRPDRLSQAAAEAVAVARVAPPDPLAALPAPRPLADSPDVLDDALLGATPTDLAASLVAMLAAVRAQDARVSIDKAHIEVEHLARAIVSSEGVAAAWRGTSTAAMLFGMAVDGADVGSFSYDQVDFRTRHDREAAQAGLVERFVRGCVGALAAGPGEGFRGPVFLTEDAVAHLVLSPLLSALSAAQVRQGRSPLADRLGEAVASSALTLTEAGAGLPDYPLAPFDREGMPRAPRALLDGGRLQSFLWSSREGRAANNGEAGHAQGSATRAPQVGPAALSLAPGTTPRAALEEVRGPLLVVTRFSGTTNPVSGEFSGVVKGGFLVRDGQRRPVREVTIAGNLFDCLQNISGISAETRRLFATWQLPSLRIEDVSITAG